MSYLRKLKRRLALRWLRDEPDVLVLEESDGMELGDAILAVGRVTRVGDLLDYGLGVWRNVPYVSVWRLSARYGHEIERVFRLPDPEDVCDG
jgi:hypothetical protein